MERLMGTGAKCSRQWSIRSRSTWRNNILFFFTRFETRLGTCIGTTSPKEACWDPVRDFAKQLGQKEVAALLDETLAEEKNADKTLTVASKQVNAQAKQEG